MLERCLTALADNLKTAKYLNVETFVVDNASSDGSPVLVSEHFPWVELVENQANVGFSKANNQGIRKSQGRYILLLNPDTELHPQALGTMISFLVDHPEVGAAGARLLNSDGSLQLSCQPRPTLFREAWMLILLDRYFRFGSYDMSQWDCSRARQVDVVKGACLITPRDVLFKVGLLDEDYFLYAEELDLCTRIQRAGYPIYWVPTAVVTHHGEQSTSQVSDEMFQELYVAKHRFFCKQYGWLAGLAFKLILLISAVPRVIFGLFAYLRPKSGRGQWQKRAQLHYRLALSILTGRFGNGTGLSRTIKLSA